MIEFAESKLELNNVYYYANIANLENAVIIVMYEGKERLGTVAFAMPGMGEMRASQSSALIGAKYIMTARALAERGAAKFGKLCLLSIHTNLDEPEALRLFSRLLEKQAP
jgi:hypothetical protein